MFSSGGRLVSLAPSPGFLAENERLGHSVSPCLLRAWLVGSDYHPLCPVGALKDYVRATSRRSPSRLFVWPDSFLPLSRRHISKLLCAVFEEADPGSAPKGHDVRAMSASLAFLRHYSLDRMVQDGQWASDRSFVDHYLLHAQEGVPCSNMAGPPSPVMSSSSSSSTWASGRTCRGGRVLGGVGASFVCRLWCVRLLGGSFGPSALVKGSLGLRPLCRSGGSLFLAVPPPLGMQLSPAMGLHVSKWDV